jgi:hypothetical protein
LEASLFTLAFDLESIPFGKETEVKELEQGATQNLEGIDAFMLSWHEINRGRQWRADAELCEVVANPFQKYWNQCAEWLGVEKIAISGMECRLRVLDRSTNRVIYQSPRFVNSSPRMASDGASYALLTDSGELSLWNAESHLRWPWALVLSVCTLSAILLIGRWRSVRPGIR